MVTSKGACASCLAAERPPNPATIITTRWRRDVACVEVMLTLASLCVDLLELMRLPECRRPPWRPRAAPGWRSSGFVRDFSCDPHCRCHGLPFGYRVKEGIAAGRKASDFDFQERTRHQRSFGAPSLDHAVVIVGPVVLPDRHDWALLKRVLHRVLPRKNH